MVLVSIPCAACQTDPYPLCKTLFRYFYILKFAYVKKKCYLCSLIEKTRKVAETKS